VKPGAAERVPRALTIAGSDSGGGAGIQADLKTFAAFSVYGTSAIVALTAQNTREVTAIHEVPPEIVRAQIEAVVSDIGVDAAKTGMLGSSLLVETVADAVAGLRIPNLVVDPVMVSKAGAPLLKAEAVETLRRKLLPLARIVTPNLPEAEILSGEKINGPEALRRAAVEIRRMGPQAVVIKGGHGEGDPVDLFYDGEFFLEFRGPRIRTRSDHGTGCTFSAAIAALLARGEDLRKAVEEAKRYVEGAIRSARPIGSGHGPLNHFYRFTAKE
jgi:hydroxymethylpyrimidine kinase/phosphomethylpyrimidine kinase